MVVAEGKYGVLGEHVDSMSWPDFFTTKDGSVTF